MVDTMSKETAAEAANAGKRQFGAPGTVSKRTVAVAGLGALGIIVVYVVTHLRFLSDTAILAANDVGGILVIGAATAVVLWTAFRFEPHEKPRREWLLIGLGLGAYVVGDIVWTYIEVIQGKDVPYPGLPDVFYMSQYVLLGGGVIIAALAYRRLAPMRGPVLSTILATGALGAALYFTLLEPVIADTSVPLGERLLSTFYPLGDLVLLLAPALLIAFIVRGGTLAWPWWLVAAGMIIVALSDSIYSLLELHNLYQSGALVDYGWMVGFLLISVGASLTRDVLS